MVNFDLFEGFDVYQNLISCVIVLNSQKVDGRSDQSLLSEFVGEQG